MVTWDFQYKLSPPYDYTGFQIQMDCVLLGGAAPSRFLGAAG
jgi:hypothetical protein